MGVPATPPDAVLGRRAGQWLAAAALAATSGLLALATAPAAAADAGSSQPPAMGVVTTTLDGVPAQVAVGSTFEPSFTVSSTSADSVELLDLCLGMWNTDQADDAQTDGISVEWKDPSTGDWVGSDEIDPGGEWTLDRSGGIAVIPPYGTIKVRTRITMTDPARHGIEHFDVNGACAYAILDPSGTNIPGVLEDDFPQTAFVYGLAGRRQQPTQQQSTSAPASTPVREAPPASVQPAETTPAVEPSPTAAPSTQQSTATTAAAPLIPAAPSPTGSKLALNTAGGDSTDPPMDAVPLTVTAAALLTFAGAALIIHRRRGSEDQADGGPE